MLYIYFKREKKNRVYAQGAFFQKNRKKHNLRQKCQIIKGFNQNSIIKPPISTPHTTQSQHPHH